MPYSKNNTDLIESGACWCFYKNLALGSTQGGPTVGVENTTHEVLIDQNGQEVVAETGLGGKAMAEVPMVETNPGLLAAIVPAAEAVSDPSDYLSDPGTSYAAGEVTTALAIPSTIKVGDIAEYEAASGTVFGVVAQYDIANKKIKLMDGNEAPVASPSVFKLYAVNGVKFHSSAGLNLKAIAGELIFIPKDENVTNYHILPLAGVNFNPESQFDNETERIMNISFTGYPDASKEHSTLATGLVYYVGTKAAYDTL